MNEGELPEMDIEPLDAGDSFLLAMTLISRSLPMDTMPVADTTIAAGDDMMGSRLRLRSAR